MDFLSSALKFVTHRDFWFVGACAAGVIFGLMITFKGDFGFGTGLVVCGVGGAVVGGIYRVVGMIRRNY